VSQALPSCGQVTGPTEDTGPRRTVLPLSATAFLLIPWSLFRKYNESLAALRQADERHFRSGNCCRIIFNLPAKLRRDEPGPYDPRAPPSGQRRGQDAAGRLSGAGAAALRQKTFQPVQRCRVRAPGGSAAGGSAPRRSQRASRSVKECPPARGGRTSRLLRENRGGLSTSMSQGRGRAPNRLGRQAPLRERQGSRREPGRLGGALEGGGASAGSLARVRAKASVKGRRVRASVQDRGRLSPLRVAASAGAASYPSPPVTWAPFRAAGVKCQHP
jgi:hypothetical protein